MGKTSDGGRGPRVKSDSPQTTPGALQAPVLLTETRLVPAGTTWFRLLLDLVPAGHQGWSGAVPT